MSPARARRHLRGMLPRTLSVWRGLRPNRLGRRERVAARNASESKPATEPGDADQGAVVDRSSILRASTIYDQGEPFHEGFAFFVAPSWGDTMTSRKEAGAPGAGARLPGAGSVSRQHSPNWTPLPRNRASVPRERRSMPRERPISAVRGWMVPSGGRGTASRGRASPAARDSDPRPRQQPAATRKNARTSGRPAITNSC